MAVCPLCDLLTNQVGGWCALFVPTEPPLLSSTVGQQCSVQGGALVGKAKRMCADDEGAFSLLCYIVLSPAAMCVAEA
jgi:hypothetical protein